MLDPKPTAHLLRSLQVKGLIAASNSSSEKNKLPLLTTTGTEMLAKAMTLVESANATFFASIDLKKMVSALQILASTQ